ncbi:MAG: hypothetical protein KAH01_03985, partial [Caldisericia bacterium]|nr:hypothetical protein [Caldisericia bacterium]
KPNACIPCSTEFWSYQGDKIRLVNKWVGKGPHWNGIPKWLKYGWLRKARTLGDVDMCSGHSFDTESVHYLSFYKPVNFTVQIFDEECSLNNYFSFKVVTTGNSHLSVPLKINSTEDSFDYTVIMVPIVAGETTIRKYTIKTNDGSLFEDIELHFWTDAGSPRLDTYYIVQPCYKCKNKIQCVTGKGIKNSDFSDPEDTHWEFSGNTSIIQSPQVMDSTITERKPYDDASDPDYSQNAFDAGYHFRTYYESGTEHPYIKQNNGFFENPVLNIYETGSLSQTIPVPLPKWCDENPIHAEPKEFRVVVAVKFYIQMDKDSKNNTEHPKIDVPTITFYPPGQSAAGDNEPITREITSFDSTDHVLTESFKVLFTETSPATLLFKVEFDNFYGGVVDTSLLCGGTNLKAGRAEVTAEGLNKFSCTPDARLSYFSRNYGYNKIFMFDIRSARQMYGLPIRYEDGSISSSILDIYDIEYTALNGRNEIVHQGRFVEYENPEFGQISYVPSDIEFYTYTWEIVKIVLQFFPKNVMETLNFRPPENPQPIFSSVGYGAEYPGTEDPFWKGDVIYISGNVIDEYGTKYLDKNCKFSSKRCNETFVYPTFKNCDGYYIPGWDVDRDEYPNCCGYMPKDYRNWKNGAGVPKIKAPYIEAIIVKDK